MVKHKLVVVLLQLGLDLVFGPSQRLVQIFTRYRRCKSTLRHLDNNLYFVAAFGLVEYHLAIHDPIGIVFEFGARLIYMFLSLLADGAVSRADSGFQILLLSHGEYLQLDKSALSHLYI